VSGRSCGVFRGRYFGDCAVVCVVVRSRTGGWVGGHKPAYPNWALHAVFFPVAQDTITRFNNKTDIDSNCSKHLLNRSGCRGFPNLICQQFYSPPFSLLHWFIIYKGPTLGSIYECLTRHQDVFYYFMCIFSLRLAELGWNRIWIACRPNWIDDPSF